MNVIVVGEKEENANLFLDEVESLSAFQFLYKNWREILTNDSKIILFQWPERIFEWKEPTHRLLEEFERAVKQWKTKCKIIYQVHNIRCHFGMNERYRRLYEIVEINSDYMVHFGHYSKEKYQKIYPDKNHSIIHHPIYNPPFKGISQNEARIRLGIPSNSKVMIAPGRIRNLEERELILKAYKYLNIKSKFLIVPYMRYKPSQLEFRGRHLLKRIFNVRVYQEKRLNQFRNDEYLVSYGFHSFEELSLKILASDFVFIPRLDVLNSGIVFLALTFNKPFVGPKVGNITEILETLNLPGYEINNKRSLKKAINCETLTRDNSFKYKDVQLEPYQPRNIAKKWDNLFNEI